MTAPQQPDRCSICGAPALHTNQNMCKNYHSMRPQQPPAPQQPAPDDHYTGTCAMQEKCNDYADFCESVMDELTENEDEDPPCPIKCAKRVNPNQADCTEAARQAREEMAKELSDIIKSEWMCDLAEILYIIEGVSKGKGNPFVKESLRGERR